MDEILIWGAGAIGGPVGAYLVRAGHKVTSVDLVEDHVAAIRAGRLRIHGPVEDFTVGAPAFTPADLAGRFKLVLLAVKAHHTADAARALAPHLADDGAVVSFQNGLNELVIADIVGRGRTIGAFVNYGADWHGPGDILYGNRGAVVVGELDGARSARIEALHRLLLDFEPDAVLTANIFGYLWGKLGYGALLKASALTNASIADYIAEPRYRALHARMCRELAELARAEGVEPMGFNGYDPAAFLAGDGPAIDRSIAAMVAFNRQTAKTHSGIWRDIAVRKRRTDAAAQLAPALAAAARLGVAVPVVRRLVDLTGDVEEGRRPQGWETADLLLTVSG